MYLTQRNARLQRWEAAMRKKAKKLNFWNVMLLIACFFFLIFFIYPVANILKESMLDKSGSFSLAAFKKFWS